MSKAVGVMKNPFPGLRGGFRAEPAQKGPDARRRPKAAREPYSLYGERAAEGANEADGPFSAACSVVVDAFDGGAADRQLGQDRAQRGHARFHRDPRCAWIGQERLL